MIPYDGKTSIGSTPNIALEIEDNNKLIYNILLLCDGKNDTSNIKNKLLNIGYKVSFDNVKSIIESISEYPYIMEDADIMKNTKLSNKQIERHSRNMNFISNFDAYGLNKYTYMEKIINSKVLVIGLGGVGSFIMLNLAALGVSDIIGVDYDIVELSNLNRQILYDENDIGKLKSQAAKERILNFNKDINFNSLNMKVENTEHVLNLIKEYNIDFVFCAADQPSIWIYKWINEACLLTNTPWIYGGNSEASSYFQTIIPFKSSCFQCRENNLYESSDEGKSKYESVLKHGYATQNNCLIATSGCLSSFMIMDFIRVITGFDTPKASNSLFHIDYRDYSISLIDIPHSIECKCYKNEK